jgi:two-component system, NarL family, nitrate/nitrite response regulator NarL
LKGWEDSTISLRIRLGIIDQHPMFRAGVIHAVAKEGDCEVVAEGAGEQDALQIATEFAPDVLLIDLHSEFKGETVQRLATGFVATRIMIFTAVEDAEAVVSALRAGAAGYMLKRASGLELVESIRRVHQGERYVYPPLAAKLLTFTPSPERDRFSALSARERQVLDDLARGLSNKEIARRLDLNEKTVKHYVSEILAKINARNRVEAAMLYRRRDPGGSTDEISR